MSKMRKVAGITILNWRWVISSPIIIPLVLLAFTMIGLHKALWYIGQRLCDLADYIYDVPTPPIARKFFDWVLAGAK